MIRFRKEGVTLFGVPWGDQQDRLRRNNWSVKYVACFWTKEHLNDLQSAVRAFLYSRLGNNLFSYHVEFVSTFGGYFLHHGEKYSFTSWNSLELSFCRIPTGRCFFPLKGWTWSTSERSHQNIGGANSSKTTWFNFNARHSAMRL